MIIRIIDILVNLWAAYCLFAITKAFLLIRFDLRYKKHDWHGVRRVIKAFALKPSTLRFQFGAIKPAFLIMPVLGNYDSETKTITIDVRVVRSKRMLMKTLLHEVCHHNQNVQGRLGYVQEKCNVFSYWFKPEEIEARGFARAWKRIALQVYKRTVL